MVLMGFDVILLVHYMILLGFYLISFVLYMIWRCVCIDGARASNYVCFMAPMGPCDFVWLLYDWDSLLHDPQSCHVLGHEYDYECGQ